MGVRRPQAPISQSDRHRPMRLSASTNHFRLIVHPWGCVVASQPDDTITLLLSISSPPLRGQALEHGVPTADLTRAGGLDVECGDPTILDEHRIPLGA
jgi:hypothetical protein